MPRAYKKNSASRGVLYEACLNYFSSSQQIGVPAKPAVSVFQNLTFKRSALFVGNCMLPPCQSGQCKSSSLS